MIKERRNEEGTDQIKEPSLKRDIEIIITKLRNEIDFKRSKIIKTKGQFEGDKYVSEFKSKINQIERNVTQINDKDIKAGNNSLILLKNYYNSLISMETDLEEKMRNVIREPEMSSNSSRLTSGSSKRPLETSQDQKKTRTRLNTGDYQSSCKICCKPTFLIHIGPEITPICSDSCLDKFE